MSSTTRSSGPLPGSPSKKTMSITQTYYLAHRARGKLSREAAQPDHDLRLLVGHANLLDSLMLELADAEREQERWFNQSVRGANKSQDRHIQWADSIAEEADEEYEESDSDSSDSDEDYEEDIEMISAPMPPKPATTEIQEEDDLEEDYAQLGLVRTPSHAGSPPELVDHDVESSDDESSMPPSPPQPQMEYSATKESKSEEGQEQEGDIYDEEYYLPARNPTGLVSAISVY